MKDFSAEARSESRDVEPTGEILKLNLATRIVHAAGDIALIIDQAGMITEIPHCDPGVIPLSVSNWVGRPWTETVTNESKPKITQILSDSQSSSDQRWRQVNHPMPDGPDLPVRYIGLPMGADGKILVLGREMQSISNLQQDLVKTQQAMEREYTRLRHAETKYRALFQMTTEAVLVLDAGTYRVVDANPAAIRLLDLTAGQLVGRYLRDWVVSEDQGPITDLFSSVRRTGNPMSENVTFKSIGDHLCRVSASLFRQGSNAHMLVRIEGETAESGAEKTSAAGNLADVISRLPEGFVITDLDGKIRYANGSFLEMSQLPTPASAEGEPLGRWVGRSDYEMTTLINAMLDDGAGTRFSTIMRGELGTVEDIEVCSAALPDHRWPCLGFSVRSIEGRSAASDEVSVLPGTHSVEDLANLIGRVSLKDIVREATDVIERLAIEAALKHTGNNRASASELLGLSRQSLYVKLHRYGIGGDRGDKS